MRHLIYIAALSLLLSACAKTMYIPVESVRAEYADRLVRDSIVLHDSIYVYIRQRNDTVYIDKEKYVYMYRDRFTKDSIFIRDTIRIPYPVETVKEVNRPTWWQTLWEGIGKMAALIFFAWIAYKFFKR